MYLYSRHTTPRSRATGACARSRRASGDAARCAPSRGSFQPERPANPPIAGVATPAADSSSVDAAARERTYWFSNTLPILADVNRDGVEDVIGGFHTSKPERVWIGAFDGEDLTPLWRAGDFGFDSDIWSVRAGDRVVVVDPTPALHVLDLATGESRHRVALSDKAIQLCASPGGNDVFVELVNEQHVRITVATGAMERIKRPAYCPKREPICGVTSRALHTRRCTRPPKSRVDDFYVNHLLPGSDIVIGRLQAARHEIPHDRRVRAKRRTAAMASARH